MKKVFVMLMAVCAMSMSSVVYAQEQYPEAKRLERKEMKERQISMMKQELNLSDEQLEQIKAAKEELDASRQGNRESMKAAHEKYRNTIDKVLTPDQKVKFDAMKKNHHGKKEFRPQGRPISRDGACKEMKCDHKHMKDCQKDCQKECDKKQDCAKMKGECKDCDSCDKQKGECDKAKACDKTQKCNKAEKCDKAQKCDKKNECTKK